MDKSSSYSRSGKRVVSAPMLPIETSVSRIPQRSMKTGSTTSLNEAAGGPTKRTRFNLGSISKSSSTTSASVGSGILKKRHNVAINQAAGTTMKKTTVEEPSKPHESRKQTATRPGRKSIQLKKSAAAKRASIQVGGTGKLAPWNLRGRIALLESKLQNYKASNADLREEIETLSRQKEEIHSKYQESIDNYSSLRKEIEELKEAHAGALDQLRKTKQLYENHEKVIKELNEEKNVLLNHIEEKNGKLHELETCIHISNMNIDALKKKCDSQVAEILSLKEIHEHDMTTFEVLKQQLQDTKSLNETFVKKLLEEEKHRRILHNTVQDLKGNIRVYCRIRPLVGSERAAQINVIDERTLEVIKPCDTSSIGKQRMDTKNSFSFDRVFSPNSNQNLVFSEIMELVQSVIDGYDVCVFAYGQTGSGKTYTMDGISTGNEEGIIPRAVRQIFERIDELYMLDWQYTVECAIFEIYNEHVRDLLCEGKENFCNPKNFDSSDKRIKIEPVMTKSDVDVLLNRARKARAVASTKCNEHSSRSHLIFRLKTKGVNNQTNETCNGELNLVDLAGSERVKESGSEGTRLTEAKYINASLSQLGNVIMSLGQKNDHIPYRNSKLTHLLQHSLGGNSKTLMFVNLSPQEECCSETLNSLRFATKVNQCHVGVASKKLK